LENLGAILIQFHTSFLTVYNRAKIVERLLKLQRFAREDGLALGQQTMMDLRDYLANQHDEGLYNEKTKVLLASIEHYVQQLERVSLYSFFKTPTSVPLDVPVAANASSSVAKAPSPGGGVTLRLQPFITQPKRDIPRNGSIGLGAWL